MFGAHGVIISLQITSPVKLTALDHVLGNFLAPLMFALSVSLHDASGETAAGCFSDALLQAFALMEF